MRSRGGQTAVSGIGSLVVSSAVATSITGTHTRTRPIASRVSALIRSGVVRRVLLMAFAIVLGLLWIGAAVSILRELIGWWAALEYAGLSSPIQ